MAPRGFFQMRATPERQERIAELGRRIGSDSTATIIDHALGIALAHTPKQEVPMLRPTPTFETYADAMDAGYRRVNRYADKDISGHNSYGYDYENADGERTVTVSLTQEKNQMGTLGCYTPMYPPTPATEPEKE